MWICLSNAFLSIVEPDRSDKAKLGDVLLVRARREGDIEHVFGSVDVQERPERDYLFRAFIPRKQVAGVIAEQVAGINYGNFKNSVKNRPLHDAFARIWSVMAGLQRTPPYSGNRGGGLFAERVPVKPAPRKRAARVS